MDFSWRTESDEPEPKALVAVDDRLTADGALSRIQRGEVLLYTGDFRNAKQLLTAMGKRLERPFAPRTAAEAFRFEREGRAREAQTLARVVVKLDAGYRMELKRAPDVAQACRWAWGEADPRGTVVPLKLLLGMLGAAEWRAKGLTVSGLPRPLVPHYGVYSPTRTDYLGLVSAIAKVEGARVFDVGTGTGVLSFLLLSRGAASVVATDLDERAVACATENAQAMGFGDRFQARVQSLFPEGQADLVVCNPPWIPEPPKNRMDRAVFDQDSAFLTGFLQGLASHLAPGGRGALILSDLAVLLGLRPAGFLQEAIAAAGLEATAAATVTPRHGKARDKADPLHEARSQEVTTLYLLRPRPG